MEIDIWDLEAGHRVILDSAAVAEVLAGTEDGMWIRVRYVQSPEDPDLIGTEDLCSIDEIVSLAAQAL